MEIRNQGQGVHAREIHGLGQLRHLPREWYAYTNLEVSVGPGQYREIDAVLVTDDRVLLVDLKDWKHRITCGDPQRIAGMQSLLHGGRQRDEFAGVACVARPDP